MKILMVSPYFYPRSGGLENYVYNIGRFMARTGEHAVSVICSRWERGEPVEEAIDGMKVFRLPYSFKISTTPVSPFWKRTISSVISGDRPDVINGHTPVPFIADVAARIAREKEIPFVLTCHDTLAQSSLYSVMSSLYFALCGNTTLKLSNHFLVNSPQTAKTFHPSLERDYPDKITIVPPGVDPDLFRPTGEEGGGEKILLFVGQLYQASRKGLDVLIRSLPAVLGEVPTARLRAIGPGPVEPYRKLATEMGVSHRVEFLGQFRQAELPRHYNQADVVILPSCKRAEGFGMSLIEAQACRKPVVGTRVGGIPYAVLDGETGLLVPPRDPGRLARAIIRLLADRELAGRLAANGYRRVREEFTWEKNAQKTLEVYKRVAG